jgi:hypothetical protein
MLGCLLTTQQRSTKGSPVHLFLEKPNFSLACDLCENESSLESFILAELTAFGRIRTTKTIAREASRNWKRLRQDLWTEVEACFARLNGQRSQSPSVEHLVMEREAAHWADGNFAGFGPNKAEISGHGSA